MKKMLWIILAFIFIAGCKENNVEAPSTTKEEKQALKQISNNTKQKNAEFQKSPEINRAENLVRQYLELGDSPNTAVEFDHKAENGYVIHVYDVIKQVNQTEYSITRGWFLVTLEPENIKVLK
ncbi:hypothetical protein [Schinkia azotoformans]|uniref:hypothetical protein n=1 Tax=Schinkia azotoformans TaxID=1454 RepID=UPI002DBDC35D|nr:hypothetical protein [Schinkia azotoformans]MEC1718221.1 hypothetical protein [Schinkia azotoformans]MEC1740312.1 hypothetical protein [Schinkia azotoformans]MEC1747192.1 hypothetical protein [Schinkia azotoformans]MEC1757405.1 hypothetical protein [Schinkia azotoformans]MEC1768955.1 hypothetical protein [Schinkia azotoformans]